MTRGRKPLPTAVKELRGNPGHRTLNKAEPQPARPRRVPPPPAHLKGMALTKWKQLAAQLYQTGVLTEVDLDALARYCVVYQRWREAEKALQKDGAVLVTTDQNYMQNPWLAISNKCVTQLNVLAVEFGITPSSRSKVKAAPLPEEEKLEEKLFGARVKVKK